MTELEQILLGLVPGAKATTKSQERKKAGGGITWSSLAHEVRGSSDLERIIALPRRELSLDTSNTEILAFQEPYRRPGGSLNLDALQCSTLKEARDHGLVGMIAAGRGKTPISFLLPAVLESKVAVLLIPASLREQTYREYARWSKHFRLHNLAPGQPGSEEVHFDTEGVLHVVAYSTLQVAKTADILERICPDLVIADEAQSLRELVHTARGRRFKKFMRAKRPRYIPLTGTPFGSSLAKAGPMFEFALGQGSPLPLKYPVLQEWAAVLDPGDYSPPPGELVRLCEPGEDVRSGFRRRLIQTPGVVATSENEVPTPLYLYERKLEVPPEVNKALHDLRATWTTPWGEEFADALALSRYARQVAAGIWLKRVWPRGEPKSLQDEWLEAKQEWSREVRAHCKLAIPGQDSELLCAQAAATGRWNSGTWERWAAVKPLAKPSSEAIWISEFMVHDALAWGAKEPGIIFYNHKDFGRRIAELGNLPLYGADTDPGNEQGDRTIVASVHSQGTGKNLQKFYRAYVSTLSSSQERWEQLLARIHRKGQTADQCSVYLPLHTEEMRGALESALELARRDLGVSGASQRLLSANWTFSM